MLTVAYYFLQVCLCSAVMMGYYALVLRNKRFHQYNRFYLLGVAILPWLVPLVKIEINKSAEAPTLPVQLFAVIADANSEFEQTVTTKGFQLTWDVVAMLLYITVSSIFLLTFIIALVKIYWLFKHNYYKHLDDVYLVLTKANGTPFSFFKFIFWNAEIDVTTHTGKQMLQHELTHVQERHSADKLLMQMVLILGWFNPIFWLLKRELETIHEFIADNKTIANGDTATLATMLLTAAYPQQKFVLTNPFFYSPIKRRIAMLTNNKNPKFSYARRLVVLPLLVAITLLFAFRKKEDKPVTISVASAIENIVGSLSNNNAVTGRFSTNFNPVMLNKTYTVVIDAGHGGTDPGSSGVDGISHEKDIALSIAKLVKASNSNANINIVLTRDNDVTMTPPQRVDYANNIGADLLVSIHCNTSDIIKQFNKNAIDNLNEGVEILIANKQKAKDYDANYNLAGALSFSLIKKNRVDKGILTRLKSSWVLQAVNCPSALIECGYMDNKADLEKLKNNSYQQVMATNILKGIELYLANKENGVSAVVVDTVPRKKSWIADSISFIKAKSFDKKKDDFFEKNEYLRLGDTLSVKQIKIEDVSINSIIVYRKKIITKDALDKLYKQSFMKFELALIKINNNIEKYGEAAKDGVISVREVNPYLIIIDGKEAKDNLYDTINPNSIKSINVLKDKNATDKYGEKGKNGVIEVELKKEGDALDDGKIFTEVQIPAEFPGSAASWKKYLERNLKVVEEAKAKNAPAGKYSVTISFLVQKDGSLSHIDALTNPGFGIADAAIALMAKCPKWIPAMQNGKKVNSIKKLTITFLIDEKSVFSSKNLDEQLLATQRVLPAELKKFQRVSSDIVEAFWIGSVSNLFIKIIHKNGVNESYDLFNVKSKQLALAKYDESLLLNCKYVLKAIAYKKKSLKA